jgi:hypothetical protein
MRILFFLGFLAMLGILSCSNIGSLPEQLKTDFAARVKLLDPSLVLDSFHVLHTDTLTPRVGRIIDDTIYKRELYRVQAQMANATRENKTDSMEFYQYELNYMGPVIDSITKSIAKTDTTKKLGILLRFTYQISKNNLRGKGFGFCVLDEEMVVENSDMIDSSLARTYRRLK